MVLGFLIDRSDYYGLPSFLMTVALTICGTYLAAADGINTSIKLFLCFLSPSIGLAMGIVVIESYLYHNNDSLMDYNYYNNSQQYPSLNGINGCICTGACLYFLITLLMPLDRFFRDNKAIEIYLNMFQKDQVYYPCDNEEDEKVIAGDADVKAEKVLLNVQNLCHIYPDGTNALKDMSFQVKCSEVLSFLGANGAGKSTTMKMLCGTLDATYGDAIVNGYSITTQRTLARRNLGIAMQQDIIWVSVI